MSVGANVLVLLGTVVTLGAVAAVEGKTALGVGEGTLTVACLLHAGSRTITRRRKMRVNFMLATESDSYVTAPQACYYSTILPANKTLPYFQMMRLRPFRRYTASVNSNHEGQG